MNAEKLQIFLAKVLFGKEWEANKELIIHKQGNLFNVQQLNNASAYFLFYVSSYEKKTLNSNIGNVHTANVMCTLHLQGIGKEAEDLMLTTLFWDERSDVRTYLEELNSSLLESPRAVYSAPYFQDGANTILAYETVFKISCALTLKEESEAMPNIELNGSLTTP